MKIKWTSPKSCLQRIINCLAQDIASQAENTYYAGEIIKGIIKRASLTPVNGNKMPANATTISPSASVFDSKESNENGDSTMPEVDCVLSIQLKFL